MYLLIDIGGTKTRVTITEHREAFVDPLIFPTPQEFDEWMRQLVEHTKLLTKGKKLSGIVVGVPGTFLNRSIINHTPNLPKWDGVHIQERLANYFECATRIENDTALVGLGEAVYGAGKGHAIVAYVTISTGVNGVRIVDGAIDASTSGFEIGHTIIDEGKDVESLIGGGALEKRFGKPSHEVHDIRLWENVTHHAGIFGANTIMYWSPSIIIYGGPVMNDLHIESIEREAKKFLGMYPETPIFIRGTLKDFGGLYGALAHTKTFIEAAL